MNNVESVFWLQHRQNKFEWHFALIFDEIVNEMYQYCPCIWLDWRLKSTHLNSYLFANKTAEPKCIVDVIIVFSWVLLKILSFVRSSVQFGSISFCLASHTPIVLNLDQFDHTRAILINFALFSCNTHSVHLGLLACLDIDHYYEKKHIGKKLQIDKMERNKKSHFIIIIIFCLFYSSLKWKWIVRV